MVIINPSDTPRTLGVDVFDYGTTRVYITDDTQDVRTVYEVLDDVWAAYTTTRAGCGYVCECTLESVMAAICWLFAVFIGKNIFTFNGSISEALRFVIFVKRSKPAGVKNCAHIFALMPLIFDATGDCFICASTLFYFL